MKEILKVNNLIKKFPKAGGEIDDADAISVLKGINLTQQPFCQDRFLRWVFIRRLIRLNQRQEF